MAGQDTITSDAFSQLLYWLDPDMDQAGHKYEALRTRLIRLFTNRGCHDPELLADHTIDRVTLKVADPDTNIDDNQIRYIYTVAAFIHKEWLREQKIRGFEVPVFDLIAAADVAPTNAAESSHGCLDVCLAELSPDDHHMIVEYYREHGSAKTIHRRSIAEQLKISMATLHKRADRVRARLFKCIDNCTEIKS